jgi:hypothetical protein
MTHLKVNNNPVKNNSEGDEMSDKDISFKKMTIRMINKTKEVRNKYLNEFQKDTNKQPDEIRKTMQDMKEQFNKYTEKLKNQIVFWK